MTHEHNQPENLVTEAWLAGGIDALQETIEHLNNEIYDLQGRLEETLATRTTLNSFLQARTEAQPDLRDRQTITKLAKEISCKNSHPSNAAPSKASSPVTKPTGAWSQRLRFLRR